MLVIWYKIIKIINYQTNNKNQEAMKNTINTWDDVCAFHKISTDALPDVSRIPEEDHKAVISHYKMMKAVDAINGGKKHDWDNWGAKKWYPVFDMEKGEDNPTGFGFADSLYDDTHSAAGVGSRLSYVSEAGLMHGVTVFLEWYRDFMVIEQK